ncbi:TRAP-type mannitol/chloroaromatic compound transport system permease small subunit [Hasllibacter halocynthiae]|uniref:TRAP transporter small permease protein n=1 Tax=Hasllibacter halocynthiae TaxID=595589 RepID=A0A2T0X761_9RHOB|nr:TRAP transporter small permease [Hasllibacter halocynthiae]PRY94767.1 TRAP-type mannitol/chloroaromatic compound transport system permease small subunit [Hasllibacter halocynthiae]
MAGPTNILSDGSALSRLDRALFRVEGWLALIAGLAVLGLMALAVVSVGGRNFLGRPLSGYVDWIELAMPFIAFLAISYTQRLGGHVRMDIVIGRLGGRTLWAAEWLTTLLTLALAVALCWGTWQHFGRSFDWDMPRFSRDSSIDIGLPLWPAKLVVPVAFAILSLRLALQLWGFGRAFARGEERPVAVPLIESAAEVAAAEAAALERAGR